MSTRFLHRALFCLGLALTCFANTSCSDDEPSNPGGGGGGGGEFDKAANLDYTAANSQSWRNYARQVALLLEQDGDHNFGCAGMAVADQWDGLSLHLAGNFAGIMMYAAVFAAGLKFGGCAERMLVAAAVIREIWFRKQCCGNFPDASGSRQGGKSLELPAQIQENIFRFLHEDSRFYV